MRVFKQQIPLFHVCIYFLKENVLLYIILIFQFHLLYLVYLFYVIEVHPSHF